MADLDACPHCGQAEFARVKRWPWEKEGEPGLVWGYHVICDASGIDAHPRGCGASSGWGETPEEAIAAWNRRAYLAASGDASPQPAQVAVKPLEWRKPTDHPKDPDADDTLFAADGIGGVYAISTRLKFGPPYLLWWAHDPMDWAGFDSIDAAKAAAQKDYETRIRSALAPSPADGAVEALEWIDYHYDNQDMSHLDFRIEAAGRARRILATLKGDTP